MPKCRRCAENFPNRIVIDGKQRNLGKRKFCLKCSPWDKHNTRHPDRIKNGMFIVCASCSRKYHYDKRAGHGTTDCNSCRANRHRNKKRGMAIALLGGQCSKCGYSRCQEALDFHHVNPKGKEFTVSSFFNLSWKRIQKEVEKCVLLCANCHREEHAKRR